MASEMPEQILVSVGNEDTQGQLNNTESLIAESVETEPEETVVKTEEVESTETQEPPRDDSTRNSKIEAILARTGYPLSVTSQQRVYGPPPGREDEKLPAGVQVHVGKLSYAVLEDALIEVFEQAGDIYELRLMMDPKTEKNKGFAFVTFCSKEAAENAVKMFNNYSINGKSVTVCIASPNNTLFVGSIPKSKTREDIHEAFSQEVSGIVDVIAQPAVKKLGCTDKNRGFCFLNFEDYKSAAAARQLLRSGKLAIKAWTDYKGYTCDWADPVEDISEEVMATVKTLFIKNLSESITEDMLRDRFSTYGTVEKVALHKFYAFVFFAEREAALKAIEGEHDKQFEDTTLSVELAKPISEEHRKKIRELKEKRNEYFGPRGGMGHDNRGGRKRPHEDNYYDSYPPYDDYYRYNGPGPRMDPYDAYYGARHRHPYPRGGGYGPMSRGGPPRWPGPHGGMRGRGAGYGGPGDAKRARPVRYPVPQSAPRGYADPSSAVAPPAYGYGYDQSFGAYGYGYGYASSAPGAAGPGPDYSRDDYGGYASGYQQFPGH